MKNHNVWVPTITDMVMVATLVQKGWRYDEYGETWSKEGFTRPPTMDEGEWIRRGREIDLQTFDLETAYHAQLASEP